MAFKLEETSECIFVEIKLPEEECNIINAELTKEVGYWKELAVKGAKDPSSLELKAPKRRLKKFNQRSLKTSIGF